MRFVSCIVMTSGCLMFASCLSSCLLLMPLICIMRIFYDLFSSFLLGWCNTGVACVCASSLLK